MLIDYSNIRRAADRLYSRLPRGVGIDADDLAQEAVLAGLRGRKSRDWPMIDLLRKQGWMRQHRCNYKGRRPVSFPERHNDRFKRSFARENSYGAVHLEQAWIAAVDVYTLLDRLDPRQKEAIRLHYLVGMTAPEIAIELGLSPSLAAARIGNGMKNMRSMIA